MRFFLILEGLFIFLFGVALLATIGVIGLSNIPGASSLADFIKPTGAALIVVIAGIMIMGTADPTAFQPG